MTDKYIDKLENENDILRVKLQDSLEDNNRLKRSIEASSSRVDTDGPIKDAELLQERLNMSVAKSEFYRNTLIIVSVASLGIIFLVGILRLG